MKIKTASKLSALTLALALTSNLQAATLDWSSWQTSQPDWQSTVDGWWGDRDYSSHQFVDLGSQSNIINSNSNQETSILNELYKSSNNEYFLKVTSLGSNNAQYFEIENINETTQNINGVNVPHLSFSVGNEIDGVDESNYDRVLAGLSLKEEHSYDSAKEIKVVDSNFLQYGYKTLSEEQYKYGQGNLVNDSRDGGYSGIPTLSGSFAEWDDNSLPIEKESQLITVGDISLANQTGVDAKGLQDHKPSYGVEVKEIDHVAGTEQSSTLTNDKLVILDKNSLGQTQTIIEAGQITTDNLSAKEIVTEKLILAGKDLQKTLDEKASKDELNTLQTKVDTEVVRLDDRIDGVGATVTNLDVEVKRLDDNVTIIDNKVTSEVSRLDQAILTTQETSRYYSDTKASETLTAAQDFAKAEDAKTLDAAKAEDVKVLASANAYTDAQIGAFGSTAARLNKRIDDVEETAYRGIAIALAAQQQIPNIGAGQFAVFGGVGHYEGESAGALGLAGVLADGRTSLSAALGAAGNGEVGGRLGVAYVFGGK